MHSPPSHPHLSGRMPHALLWDLFTTRNKREPEAVTKAATHVAGVVERLVCEFAATPPGTGRHCAAGRQQHGQVPLALVPAREGPILRHIYTGEAANMLVEPLASQLEENERNAFFCFHGSDDWVPALTSTERYLYTEPVDSERIKV